MFRARRPRTICLKQPTEMHHMRNEAESQLWLFQFRRGYFFIKASGEGMVVLVVVVGKGGQGNIAFCPKRRGEGW